MESTRRRPNWALVAIVAAALVTVGIVVTIFVSTATSSTHAGLPTTVALSTVPTKTAEKTVTVQFGDQGCVFATVDGVKAFAIWPKGFTRDAQGSVVAPDGTQYNAESSFTAKVDVTTRAAVLTLDGGGDDGYLGTLLTRCQGLGTHAVILTAIVG